MEKYFNNHYALYNVEICKRRILVKNKYKNKKHFAQEYSSTHSPQKWINSGTFCLTIVHCMPFNCTYCELLILMNITRSSLVNNCHCFLSSLFFLSNQILFALPNITAILAEPQYCHVKTWLPLTSIWK